MGTDWVGKKVDGILTPEDSGYNDSKTPWATMRNLSGWKKPEGVKMELFGYYLVDMRMKPYILIFENIHIVHGVPVDSLDKSPELFTTLKDAVKRKEMMGLPFSQEKKVVIVAAAPAPGMGNAHPDHFTVTKAQAMKM